MVVGPGAGRRPPPYPLGATTAHPPPRRAPAQAELLPRLGGCGGPDSEGRPGGLLLCAACSPLRAPPPVACRASAAAAAACLLAEWPLALLPLHPLPPPAGKLAGLDKKLSRSLEEEVAAGSASPSSLSKSPVGPLQESSSRKTLVYLILTLNHIYPGACRARAGRWGDAGHRGAAFPAPFLRWRPGPRPSLSFLLPPLPPAAADYDFSLLRAHHFKKEEGVSAIEELIDAHLVEASKVRLQRRARCCCGCGGCWWLLSGGVLGRVLWGLLGSVLGGKGASPRQPLRGAMLPACWLRVCRRRR